MTFDEHSFNSMNVGLPLFGIVFGGVGIVWASVKFQNKKHGFPIQAEEDDE